MEQRKGRCRDACLRFWTLPAPARRTGEDWMCGREATRKPRLSIRIGLSFLDLRKGLPCCLANFLAFGGVAVQSPKRKNGRLGRRTDLA
jgi:hypothetical protein